MKTRIQEYRKQHKLSQEELAAVVGVIRQTITSLECEKYMAQLVLAYKIAKYFGLTIEDVDELRKIYIEENDERTKLIKDKIGGVGFNFSLGMIATVAVMSGFFNQIVFITLSATLIFMALVKGFLKIHYKNKF